MVASICLHWSGGSRKIQIRLRWTVARSGDVVLPGIYLFLHCSYPNDLDTARQNNNMIWIVLYLCAATLPFTIQWNLLPPFMFICFIAYSIVISISLYLSFLFKVCTRVVDRRRTALIIFHLHREIWSVILMLTLWCLTSMVRRRIYCFDLPFASDSKATSYVYKYLYT